MQNNLKYINMNKLTRMFTVAIATLMLTSCGNSADKNSATKDKAEKKQESYVDEHFTQLFKVDKGGITGSDGIISVAMPDGRSVFMNGDSFLGEVKNGERDTTSTMINNSFIVVNPEQTATISMYQGTYDEPKSLIIPENDPGKFYWPGHGFVRDGVFHLFMSRFWIPKKTDPEGGWGFQFASTQYLRYTWPEFKQLSTQEFKYSLGDGVHWGHAVVDDGEYVYIYGTRPDEANMCHAHLCRTKITNDKALDIANAEFFDGTTWAKKSTETVPMKGITSNVSEQFSVFKYEDKYVLLSQQRGIGEGDIYTYVADNAWGPWINKQLIYTSTEHEENDRIITYNAMAHPQYIKDGELLVSYCVNALDVPLIFENVDYYRPVFIRTPMSMILGK